MWPVPGSNIVGKRIDESCAKPAWGLGRDGVVEPVSIVFNSLFRFTSSRYTLWLVNCDILNQHLRQQFAFVRTESNYVKPSYTAPFDDLTFWNIVHFDTRNGFSRSGLCSGGLRYLEGCLQPLPFPLPAVFCSFADRELQQAKRVEQKQQETGCSRFLRRSFFRFNAFSR